MHFFIKNKASELQPVYVRIHRRNPDVDMTLNTKVMVETRAWIKANTGVSAWDRYAHTERGKEVTKKLGLIDGLINTMSEKDFLDRKKVKASIIAITESEAVEAKAKIDEEEESRKHKILSYARDYYERAKSGEIRTRNGKSISKNRISFYAQVIRVLSDFIGEDESFESIDTSWVNRFSHFMRKQNYSDNTIHVYSVAVRTICSAAFNEGKTSNLFCTQRWQHVTVENTKTNVCLTEEEVNAFYSIPLPQNLALSRDLFVLGILTSQRYSDYSKISKENFVHTNACDLLCIVQQKTGTYVEIPVLDDRITEICERNNYDFSGSDLGNFNEHLRKISWMVSRHVPSMCEEFHSPLTKAEIAKEAHFIKLCSMKQKDMDIAQRHQYKVLKLLRDIHNGNPIYKRDKDGSIIKFKWELISSHTARRTGVTNLYRTGLLDTREMMSISGHKTMEMFDKYIKMTTREKALRIADKLNKKKEPPLHSENSLD